jgi:hypothetical protein
VGAAWAGAMEGTISLRDASFSAISLAIRQVRFSLTVPGARVACAHVLLKMRQ